MMQAIDSEIIRRLKGGDKAAFRCVVENCQQMVYSLSVKMLADTEEARDAVQDTFIKVWQNIANYDERYSLTTWIYTIAARICLDRLKSFSGRMQTTDDAEVFERIADDPDPERRLLASAWIETTPTELEIRQFEHIDRRIDTYQIGAPRLHEFFKHVVVLFSNDIRQLCVGRDFIFNLHI